MSQDKDLNEKTPEGVSPPDTFLTISSIADKYDIRHPKPSISRNTAKKMLERDLENLLLQARIEPWEVNRFEVVEHLTGEEGGRVLTRWKSRNFKVEPSLQDDGRTLKIFLLEIPELQSSMEGSGE